MNKKITLMDVKQALLDPRFRKTLPDTLQDDVQKFLGNPTCACNHPIYVRVIKEAPQELHQYYPAKEAPDKNIELPTNNWSVINCSVTELQARLQKLGPGRKQVEIARYQDQVTVVINDLEF